MNYKSIIKDQLDEFQSNGLVERLLPSTGEKKLFHLQK